MNNLKQKKHTVKMSRGYFVMLVLVFSAIFLTLVSSFVGYIFIEGRAQDIQENKEKALHIAESGLEYYRWFLSHFPNELQYGVPAPNRQGTVLDPERGPFGEFMLSVTKKEFCGDVSAIQVDATGWTVDDPDTRRTVRALYAKPSVAEFSHIVNERVWAGPDRVISGPYHSNQGVRMDGIHNATVSSGVEEWICTSSFGCQITQTVDGVFGLGGEDALWKFPTPQFDFNGLTLDLDILESYAVFDGGFYFGPASGNIDDRGYHVVFNGDNTFTVYRVFNTQSVYSYTNQGGWGDEHTLMSDKELVGTYPINQYCPVVFFKDRVWLEGEVSGKVVVVAADVQSSEVDADIILSGDITYATGSGTDGVLVIAERNILIGLIVPNTMYLNGIFIAQGGYFGRNLYRAAYLPSSLDQYVIRDTLHTIGTVVSNRRVGTKWMCGGVFCSGFNQRYDSYDVQLANDPPPFVPAVSNDYTFRDWQEVD